MSLGVYAKKFIIFAIVLSFGLVGGSFWNIYTTEAKSTEHIARGMELIQMSDQIRYLDEVLTMSAYMAAATSDPDAYWEKRYNQHVTQLDAVIASAATPSTRSIIDEIDHSNKQLVEIENHLFELIHQDRSADAYALIKRSEYKALKSRYSDANQQLISALVDQAGILFNRLSDQQNKTLFIVGVLLLTLLVLWIIVLWSIENYRKNKEAHDKELSVLAQIDGLTGLSNRSLFQSRLSEALNQSIRQGQPVALLIIDIDNFKVINDSYGHPTGDKLLKEVAKRLKARCRSTDIVARLGGDEFGIIAPFIDQDYGASSMAVDLVNACRGAFELNGHHIIAQCSIGVSQFPNDAENHEDLLVKADMALYQAKDAGRNTFRFFDRELENRARNRQALIKDMRNGIDNAEYQLHYQPIIDIARGELVGTEALIRWQHPTRGSVSPADFIPIAESSQLIIPLGDWVIREACQQLRRWSDKGLPAFSMSVNLSAVQFQNESLLDTLHKEITASGIEPKCLELEITESTIMESGEKVIELLSALTDLGIRLAIDDFGTGYSSLAYLKRFPVDRLKIDRAFIRDLPGDKDDSAIASTIINISKILKLQVVAEGVENFEQLEFLRNEHCHFAQGFYLAKPMPPMAFEQWYRDWRTSGTRPAQKVSSATG